MRRRIGCLWVLAGSASLAFLLALACSPGLPAGASSGMRAPAPRSLSVESPGLVQLSESQLHGQGMAVRAASVTPAFVTLCAVDAVARDAAAGSPLYGPVYRRPPPGLS
jgi:hypothetical protein